ncbi:MAG: SdpI family protein [Polyangiaceae bacterium]
MTRMMSTRRFPFFASSLGVSALAVAVSALAWSRVPARFPIHFDAAGQPDGWASRTVGLLALPVTTLVVLAILGAVRRGRQEQPSGQALGKIALATSLLLFGLHGLVIMAATSGGALAMGALMVMLGLFFGGLALMMPGLEQNPWVGIRTPWSLADEINWRLTHRFAARSMLLGAGVAVIAGLALTGAVAFGVGLTAILLGALAPVGASAALHYLK